MEKHTVFVVDDEEGIRSQLKWALADTYTVRELSGGAQALDLAHQEAPDVVLLDISLTPREGAVEGLDLIEKFLDINPYCKVIMVTGHGEKEHALTAIARGAYDFFGKPVDLDQLKIIIERGIVVAQLEKENSRLASELARLKSFESILGESARMREVYRIIKTVSGTDYTVLITGESGTGKELAAKAIHASSPRRDSPFVTINCGAIPENLLESELFGHEKGAFTDAYTQKRGKFEMADRGTIFLDEIGELSLKLQVKLLRVLEDHKIERIGGREEISLDVRILAATNRDLIDEVKNGAFREDLYYRLSVITIPMPPLRLRGDDILLLAGTFLNRYARENNKTGLGFSEAALRAIAVYDWPGNVRELENKIKRAVIMAQDKRIRPQDLTLPQASSEGVKGRTLQEVREESERKCLADSLTRNNWNISRVSRELGTSRTTLYDLIEKYQLKK
ncbi:MAG: PEP-CTERM-box response regulator transcription factor [candidate division Zixibacteria bacterium]|nr:PEP-CTERM-box response regulator transcription factor [candidate division Zixibacteria bacterium]